MEVFMETHRCEEEDAGEEEATTNKADRKWTHDADNGDDDE